MRKGWRDIQKWTNCKVIELKQFQSTIGRYVVGTDISYEGGSPGLVVTGECSNSIGCGFKSLHRILDRHFHFNLL